MVPIPYLLTFPLLLLVILRGTLAFKVISYKSTTHQEITEAAIFQITADVCRNLAEIEGRDFVLRLPLTAEVLAEACSSTQSIRSFKSAIREISNRNVWVDGRHALDEEYHFDDESFQRGRGLITAGVATVKANIRKERLEAARERLGEALHTLQDFYSHSNWIELGNVSPYTNLIRPALAIDNVADRDTPTCRSCDGEDCRNNILENILRDNVLTSGYFSLTSSSKPDGKCSHGGVADRTATAQPVGGINKDGVSADHGHLHHQAAMVATAATKELLQDIRGAAGDKNFMRLMGMSQSTSVLCFVIDTTGSMSNDIAEVKRVTSFIINSKRGGVDEPSEYVLVPFNDPDFGPLFRTKDPDAFKAQISSLSASGGGDRPEMCLSGLTLALTGSPPESEIFVFTDADAKDSDLKSTVLTLIAGTKSVVSFLMTNALRRRRRRDDNDQLPGPGLSGRVANPLNLLYQELAEASGGQAIEVTKATLPQATSIIVDASSSARVTLLHATRNPAQAENFTFPVDSSVRNLTIYITGSSPEFTISDPSALSQSNTESSGALGNIQTVGNFHTVRLNSNQPGLWQISIDSTQPYTVRVAGQSAISFLFNFVELYQEPDPGYVVLDSRPPTNANATLLLSLLGGDAVQLTEVALVEASGSGEVVGTSEKLSDGSYLITVSAPPAGDFIVRVRGESGSSKTTHDRFQRQSLTRFRTSNVTITAQTSGSLEPGATLILPFTMTTSGSGGTFKIKATNDRGFATTFPASLVLPSGGGANGTVTLTAPADTPSGTDLTLTIETEAPGGADSNYAIMRLAVVAPVTDITPPVCEIVSVNANCSGNCSLSRWELSANLTDGNGTGIQSITVQQGSGSLNMSTVVGEGGGNVTLALYTASCCSETVELVAVDAEGNVGTCIRSIAISATTTPAPMENVTLVAVSTTSSRGSSKCVSLSLWLSGVFICLLNVYRDTVFV